MLIAFIQEHLLEIIGFLFGVIYVVGAILERWWCWPASLIAIAAYGVSTYQLALYGEFSLQFFYLFLTIYGWILWRKGKTNDFYITQTNPKMLYTIMGIGLILSALFYFLLVMLHGSNPLWDALTNGFSIVATYLVAKKKIENWLFWIPVDLVLTALMFYRGMPFYGLLYLVYTMFAIYGYLEWKKKLARQNEL